MLILGFLVLVNSFRACQVDYKELGGNQLASLRRLVLVGSVAELDLDNRVGTRRRDIIDGLCERSVLIAGLECFLNLC